MRTIKNEILVVQDKKRYFPMFDYLRFACCLLIFVYHYDGLCGFGLRFNRNITLDYIIRNGNEAITLFFMLSGFCMACGYKDRISEGRVSFASYAFGHYKKFFAMILVTLPVTIIKSICMYKAGLDTMPNLFGFILDIMGIRTGYGIHQSFGYNGPLWFINVLFLMYLLYYLVAYVSRSRAVYTVSCVFLALFAISQQAMGSISVFVLNSNCYVGTAGFFIGAVLFEIYEYYSDSERQIRKMTVLSTVMILLVVSALYLNLHFPGKGILPDDSNLWVNYSLVLTLVFWPACIMVSSVIRIPRIFARFASILNKLSTSIYIWHWPVIYILYSWGVRGKVSWAIGSRTSNLLACGLTFGLAVLSALWFEKKAEKGIQRFFRKP